MGIYDRVISSWSYNLQQNDIDFILLATVAVIETLALLKALVNILVDRLKKLELFLLYASSDLLMVCRTMQLRFFFKTGNSVDLCL